MRKRDRLHTAHARYVQPHRPADDLCIELGQGPTTLVHELGFLNTQGERGSAYVFRRETLAVGP